MSDRQAYVDDNRKRWNAALKAVAPTTSDTAAWTSLSDIVATLRPFAETGCNHAHMPGGGGMDMRGVAASAAEEGCLEIRVGDHSIYLGKPQRLVLEHISDAPLESFLFLELAPLKATDVGGSRRDGKYDEVVDLGAGSYVNRRHWDDGSYGFDANGDDKPLPDDARLVVRLLQGKILIVAKGSIWNSAPVTYDGRHSNMTSTSIRQRITDGFRSGIRD